jgi:PAS domain S-box-containing protein
MTSKNDFQDRYTIALLAFMRDRDEASLAVGDELGREALLERISVLDIVEHHSRLVDADAGASHDPSAALQFLLQTLVPLDVATRGFLDGAVRYKKERARAEDLATRDAFRTAVVNSLQEGFFVADATGAVVEVNDAFAEITGYDAAGLPYALPYPWLIDQSAAEGRFNELVAEGSSHVETTIRHRNGEIRWVVVTVRSVTGDTAERHAFVGTLRDITAAHAAAVRDSALVRLAAAVGVATTVTQVLTATLEEWRTTMRLRRIVAATWPTVDSDPTLHVAGDPLQPTWRDWDPLLRNAMRNARDAPPLTVEPVASEDGEGTMVTLASAADTVLWLEHVAGHPPTAEDLSLLYAITGHLSSAIAHVRQFETAREASLTLQRAMLPTNPLPPGFAVRYEPAVAPFEVGGDWYDVLELDDHRIGIVVGDCVGRGLPAAAAMGQLRSSARALLLTGAEPAQLLEGLDAAAELIAGAYFATVFLGLLDTDSQTLRYSSAGHMPALLATPGAQPIFLDAGGSVPLAVRRKRPRPQADHVLTPQSTLMLFTDGLVERRDRSLDAGFSRAAEVLEETLGAPAEAVADAVLRGLAPSRGYDDDVAIVVYRCSPLPLRIESAATVERLGEVREQLASWMRAAGASGDLAADILMAVNEACTNSIEHGYRNVHAGTMRVDAQFRDDGIEVCVADSGSWKLPGGDNRLRGRGIPLMSAVSQRIHFDRTPTGTTVEMRFALSATGSIHTTP